MSGIYLILADSRGDYIPQIFAQRCTTNWKNIEPEDLEILLKGPDEELYWDTWESVMDSATYTDPKGYVWKLLSWWGGGLWTYCEELMTDEEKLNFFDS